MPNWCENNISIRNSEFTDDQIEYIVKNWMLNTNEEGEPVLDFEVFIKKPYPMLHLGLNNDIIKSFSAFYKYNPLNLSEEDMKLAISGKYKKDELMEYKGKNVTFETYVMNWYDDTKPEMKPEDILPNWYDWGYENWGVKWNCFESYINKECLGFDTAWNGLSKKLLKVMADEFKKILTEEQFNNLVYDAYEPNMDIRAHYNMWELEDDK